MKIAPASSMHITRSLARDAEGGTQLVHLRADGGAATLSRGVLWQSTIRPYSDGMQKESH